MRHQKNLLGKIYGKLSVLKQIGRDHKSNMMWKCRCLCGRETQVTSHNLLRGISTSCGCVHGVKISNPITHQQAFALFLYNEKTGVMTRKLSGRGTEAGDVVGRLNPYTGYLSVSINGKNYAIHRLAFFLKEGRWPSMIDHRNGARSDNKWANLREATVSQNLANSRLRSNNKSGFKGVSVRPYADKPWAAFISINGVCKNLGAFESAQDAALAYDVAAKKIFGEFALVNFSGGQNARRA